MSEVLALLGSLLLKPVFWSHRIIQETPNSVSLISGFVLIDRGKVCTGLDEPVSSVNVLNVISPAV